MQPQQLQVNANEDVLKGKYTNAMQLSHTKEEFFLDFFLMSPPTGQLSARVITSPGHMKRIASAIQENIKLYEKTHGKIKEAEGQAGEIGFKAS